MAVIGWLFIVGLGLYFVASGLFGWFIGGFWSSHVKTAGFLIFAVIGGLLLWYAYTHAPFTVSCTGC